MVRGKARDAGSASRGKERKVSHEQITRMGCGVVSGGRGGDGPGSHVDTFVHERLPGGPPQHDHREQLPDHGGPVVAAGRDAGVPGDLRAQSRRAHWRRFERESAAAHRGGGRSGQLAADGGAALPVHRLYRGGPEGRAGRAQAAGAEHGVVSWL